MKTNSLLFSCLGLALFACGAEDGAAVSASFSASTTDSAAADSAAAGAVDDTAAGDDAADGTAVDPALTEPEALPGPEPVRWRACGHIGDRNVSCAEVYVPLDHADPEGEQIAISINRVATSRAYPRRGVLLYNPGGPGLSGKAAVVNTSVLAALDEVAPGYDFVGFDPRGVAASGDRSCTALVAERLPYGSKEAAVVSRFPMVAQALAESRRCRDSWGPLFDKLGSNQVVRDLDWLRQALGEPKLNLLGASYGTRLGALYAHYFPETTGAIVLDASVPPTADLMQKTREVFAAQVRLTEYVLSLCEGDVLAPCPTEARAVFARIVSTAREYGLLENVMLAWNNALAAGQLNSLASFLAGVAATPDPSWLQSFTAPLDYGYMPLATINCIDATSEPPTLDEVESLYTELEAISPAFASVSVINAIMCAAWPVTRDPVPMPSAPDAPPVLVIGGGFDWRTPLPQAVAMTEAIGDSARLLVSNHIGHGAFVLGSECTKQAIRNFFLDGALPFEGTVCDANALGPKAAQPGELQASLFTDRPGIVAR